MNDQLIKPKRQKYRNKKVASGGAIFDSKKESRRYTELQLLERSGAIRELQTQYAFTLAEAVKFSNESRQKPAVKYIADFVYIKDGQMIVEDVKSEATKKLAVYRLKKHLMMSVHGIEVVEV